MADVVLAGGVEMMSQVPMSGYHTRLDPEITESYIGMGFTAERVAERWKVTREDQDRGRSAASRRPRARCASGAFDGQIVPVPVERVTWNGAREERRQTTEFARDELPRPDTTIEGLAKLRPAFKVERNGDGREREPVLRRRGRGAADDRRTREGARTEAARALHHVRGGGRRAGHHGRRSDQGGAESAQARRAVS